MKKNSRKLIPLLMAFGMLVSLPIPAQAATVNTGEISQSTRPGTTLQNGYTYTVTEDATIRNYSANGGNGLNVASGATVIIELNGKTINVYGSNGYDAGNGGNGVISRPNYYGGSGGSGAAGGGAGIYIPGNATLVIVGSGTINAYGGAGGNAGSGGNAHAVFPDGGAAGGGGGGAGGGGAGIGGYGGSGGYGGKGSGYSNGWGWSGSSGSSGASMGTFHVMGDAVIRAYPGGGGAYASYGASSNALSGADIDDAKAAGGNGGNAGTAAAAIGGGGAAGGGGGGGEIRSYNNYNSGSQGQKGGNGTYSTNGTPPPALKFRLEFNNQGGTGALGFSEVYYSLGLPAISELPARIGYTFNGYFTAAADGAQWYDDNGSVDTSITYSELNNTTLYAQWTEKAFTADVALSQDGAAWSGQSVELLQNGKVKYTLAAGAGGHYTSDGIRMGVYNVYVNDMDSGMSLSVDGAAENGTEFSTDVFAYIPVVNLTKNGSAWSGQTVTLRRDGQVACTLTGTNGVYTDTIFTESGEKAFAVFVGGQDAKTTLTIRNGEAPVPVSVGYYTATATVNKDGVPWSDTTVTLQADGAVKYTLRYDEASGTYKADTVLIEKNANSNEISYDLMISGAFKGGDTGVALSSGEKTAAINYYTVMYKGYVGADYAKQIVRSGLTGTMPANPYKQGQTFSGWENGKKRGEATAEITAATTIRSLWESPDVKNGDYVQCAADGQVSQIAHDNGCYRLGNLSINGYPAAGTPMKKAEIHVYGSYTNLLDNVPDESAITFISAGGFTVSDDGTVTKGDARFAVLIGCDTNSVAVNLSGAGASVADLQAFLRSCMVVQPVPSETHTIRVRVFGATA